MPNTTHPFYTVTSNQPDLRGETSIGSLPKISLGHYSDIKLANYFKNADLHHEEDKKCMIKVTELIKNKIIN